VPTALLVASFELLAAPSAALACLVALSPELHGYPSDGAVSVPTDVIPLYRAPAPTGGDTAAWVSNATLTSGADTIRLTPRNVEGIFVELVPQGALAANTEYTLSVVWTAQGAFASPGQDALSFTTGAGPSQVDDSAPRASISHYRNGSGSSCASASNSCFSLASNEVYVWQFVGADYKRVSIGSFQTNMYGAEQGHPFDCVLLQRRAPNGQLSKVSSICTFDGPMFDLASLHENPRELGSIASPICDQYGLTWSGQLVSQRVHGRAPLPYDKDAPQQHGSAEPLAALSGDSAAAIVGGDVAEDHGGCSALPVHRARSNLAFSLLVLTACCAWWRRRRQEEQA
jgi:hypothetical protein